ncbi:MULTISPECIES: SDR family oxidoreductase [Nonomuraea]|uniref:SDR family oxidoreductase n=1 Tax=Nonomuraea ferruginea TaxID=46174 RepID=A0ABT4T7W6_9ACTN|nr:SDR family oxidoreductase [Nonomuraea ferruginea]MDA0645613.1 SDR family oxidoreductase [Nonomuraea ferruginea]
MTAPTPDAILLDGRVAVVAGAARGAGRAIAEALAVFGARVAACDRDRPRGDLAMTVRPGDAMAAEVFARAVADRWGRVDVLVTSAGGFDEPAASDERAVFEEHFGQVTELIRRMLPLMRAGGAIINVSSGEARRAAVYGAMRAALESLTATLAVELAPRGIRVNAIALGGPPPGGKRPAEEAAGAAVFLAGDLARSVTGTTVRVTTTG